MIDWTNIIMAVLGLAGGSSVSYVFFYKAKAKEMQAKADMAIAEAKKAEAETKITEIDAKMAEVNVERSLIDNYEKILERSEKIITEQDERYDRNDKFHVQRYEELSKMLEQNCSRLRDLERKMAQQDKLVCYSPNCPNRQVKLVVK